MNNSILTLSFKQNCSESKKHKWGENVIKKWTLWNYNISCQSQTEGTAKHIIFNLLKNVC